MIHIPTANAKSNRGLFKCEVWIHSPLFGQGAFFTRRQFTSRPYVEQLECHWRIQTSTYYARIQLVSPSLPLILHRILLSLSDLGGPEAAYPLQRRGGDELTVKPFALSHPSTSQVFLSTFLSASISLQRSDRSDPLVAKFELAFLFLNDIKTKFEFNWGEKISATNSGLGGILRIRNLCSLSRISISE